MTNFRMIWQRLYRKAIDSLKSSTNPIEKFTWDIIQKHKLIIKPFCDIHLDDFDTAIEHIPKKHQKSISRIFPPLKSTIDKIEDDMVGLCTENRIYISKQIKTISQWKKILVHEVNHYVNHTDENYDTDKDVAREEMRAHIAEALINARTLTSYFLKKTAKQITKAYRLKIPATPILPKGIYHHSLKI